MTTWHKADHSNDLVAEQGSYVAHVSRGVGEWIWTVADEDGDVAARGSRDTERGAITDAEVALAKLRER